MMRDTRASFKDANVNHNNGNNDNLRGSVSKYFSYDVLHDDEYYIKPICYFLEKIDKRILQSFFDVKDIDFREVDFDKINIKEVKAVYTYNHKQGSERIEKYEKCYDRFDDNDFGKIFTAEELRNKLEGLDDNTTDRFVYDNFIERHNAVCELKRYFYKTCNGSLLYTLKGDDIFLYLKVLQNFKYKLSIPKYNIEAIIYVDNTETKDDYPSQITMTCGNKVLKFNRDTGWMNIYYLDKEGKKNGIEFVCNIEQFWIDFFNLAKQKKIDKELKKRGNKFVCDLNKGLLKVSNFNKEGKKNGIEFVYDLSSSYDIDHGIAIKKVFYINGEKQDVKVVHSNKYDKNGNGYYLQCKDGAKIYIDDNKNDGDYFVYINNKRIPLKQIIDKHNKVKKVEYVKKVRNISKNKNNKISNVERKKRFPQYNLPTINVPHRYY